MSKELEQFVASFGTGLIQSQGEFSLNEGAALQKLRKNLFPSDSYYVLKFIQAAVGWRSSQIKVKGISYTLRIDCRTQVALPTPSELVEGFSQPLSLPNGPLRDLALGMFTVPLGRSYTLHIKTSGKKFTLRYRDGHFSPRSRKLRRWEHEGFTITIEGLSYATCQTELSLIRDHCCNSQIALKLNGVSPERVEGGALVERVVRGENNRLLSLVPSHRGSESTEHGILNPTLPHATFLSQADPSIQPGKGSFQQVLYFNRRLEGHNQIVLFQRGVEVQRIKVGDSEVGATALVDVENLEFDLGGFQAREGEPLDALVRDIEKSWHQMAKDVSQYLPRLPLGRSLLRRNPPGPAEEILRQALGERIRDYLGEPSSWQEFLSEEFRGLE